MKLAAIIYSDAMKNYYNTFPRAGRQPPRVTAPVHVRHVAAEGPLHAPRLGRQQPGPQPLPVTPGTRATCLLTVILKLGASQLGFFTMHFVKPGIFPGILE